MSYRWYQEGRTHGKIKKIIDQKKIVYPWLTKNNVYYQLQLIQSLPPSLITPTPQPDQDNLNPTKTINNCVTNNESPEPAIPSRNNVVNLTSTNPSLIPKKTGHPKGSTIEKKLDTLRREDEAKVVATKAFMKMKNEKGRVNKNNFDNIIQKVRDNFNLPSFSMN